MVVLGTLEPILSPDKLTSGECGVAAEDVSVVIEANKLCKIGRNNIECSIQLTHPSVSNVHCVIWGIRFDEESIPMCYVKDCSLNGTFINGELLQRNKAYLLQHDDIIMIPNDFEFRFSTLEQKNQNTVFEALNIKQKIDNWMIMPKIVGCGTFGHVLVAKKIQNKNTCKPLNYAVKILKVQKDRINKEANILEKLTHPNIIKVYQTITDNVGNMYIFEDLICGGDLFSYLAKTDCLSAISETESLIIVYQILQALKFLHSNGIVHRDLKLDNILLCSPEPCSKVVLADFGIAKDISNNRTRMYTVVGTPEYCAPEVGFKVNRNAYREFSRTATLEFDGYDSKCDLWSLGVITHIMLTGISPFYGDGTEACIINNVKLGKINFDARQWNNISDTAKIFVRKLLEVNVKKRPNVHQSLSNIWITKHRGQLEKIYYKKILGEDTFSPTMKLGNNTWKRNFPKSVMLSPKIQKKKMRVSMLTIETNQ